MDVLFSDLDNTLVFSRRKQLPAGKITAEQLDGKDQSYMTEYTFSFLRNLSWLTLVPVTTRSESQYRRLAILGSLKVRYAILCNGGKLLVDGREDAQWTGETLEQVREDLPELRRLAGLMGRLDGHEVHMPEPYYFYMKSDAPADVCALLEKSVGSERIRVSYDHRKVYLFPGSVSKGAAVRRFSERFPVRASVGAGDGLMDLSMLESVGFALAPEPLFSLVRNPNVRRLDGDIFSDSLCRALESLRTDRLLQPEDSRDD